MFIENHLLKAEHAHEKIVQSPSPNARGIIDPDYLIIHYTAGDTARAAIDWFMNTANNPDKIAAHIVLDLDGTITQLVPFNRRANHAGSSVWDGVENFNFHSVGIELVNPGFCEKLTDGSYKRKVTATKHQSYPAGRAKDILETRHKHKFWTANDNKHWFKFPKAQLTALYELSKTLVNHYQMVTVLGHDDISPLRKPDPGPCFPWREFKTNVLGRPDHVGDLFLVNTAGTNFRVDHSTNSPVIKSLSKGYQVGLIETFGAWSKVYLANDKKELMQDGRCIKSIGWIHSSLLDLK
ncbi:N-acetylmuramoyl-L-alanine amidase [Pseudocnuella soli]|uniref:N-acetylmuramoyl-L-alanine amidase n=1 Tax=Pseudocnuella soli TaxID=2502779 RepID=UPI001044D989|nr:N-acetylmuramoyl-L-alanine amidase [Pseudocnuella soli]